MFDTSRLIAFTWRRRLLYFKFLPLLGVEAAVGWLQSLQMPAFLEPKMPTGLHLTWTK